MIMIVQIRSAESLISVAALPTSRAQPLSRRPPCASAGAVQQAGAHEPRDQRVQLRTHVAIGGWLRAPVSCPMLADQRDR